MDRLAAVTASDTLDLGCEFNSFKLRDPETLNSDLELASVIQLLDALNLEAELSSKHSYIKFMETLNSELN